QRLADSPACLVAAKHGPDLEVERLLSRQSRGVGVKPILELNTRHALVRAIASAQKDSRETDVNDLSTLLFEQARILDGEVPDDPSAFVERLMRVVAGGLAIKDPPNRRVMDEVTKDLLSGGYFFSIRHSGPFETGKNFKPPVLAARVLPNLQIDRQ